MPCLPAWGFQSFEGVGYHTLDWSAFFRLDLSVPGQPTPGEMRGFHVVFRLRVQRAGLLLFFDTDGSIIRRNGKIVHEDRSSHPMTRHELAVRYGDRLEVAQWQLGGSWIWAARWERVAITVDALLEEAEPYRRSVEDALARPEGPALKVYTNAASPVRCALSIYSLVLNGYRPSGIQVFGNDQWSERSTRIMRQLLPFAEIVATDRVESTLEAIDSRLIPLTRRSWGAMKICIGLFYPPREYCFLDDDIFVLDRLADALRLHRDHTLVYAPDRDYADRYEALQFPRRQEEPERRPLSCLSTGFYMLRNGSDLRAQSDRLLRTPSDGHLGWIWEQGFFAWEFSNERAALLPTQRYFVPIFDGLPGGLHGYDWHANPCEFACVHFGGPAPKPKDEDAAALFHDILRRHRTAE